jgi:polyisoprenoid-binding protein YceI
MVNQKLQYYFYLALMFWSAACMQEPKSDDAIVGEALPVEEKTEGRVFAIDTSQSILTWVGTKPSGRHNGLIRIKSGSITILAKESEQKEKEYALLNALITIDMGRVEVLDLKDDPLQMEKLERHLYSEDFFDSNTYPEAIFELISFEPIEDDTVEREDNKYTIIDPTHIMNGNLTIRGKTLNVEFPVKADYRNLRFEASAKFNIDRTDWNITYQNENDPKARLADGFIHNIVNVGFEIIARPESEE